MIANTPWTCMSIAVGSVLMYQTASKYETKISPSSISDGLDNFCTSVLIVTSTCSCSSGVGNLDFRLPELDMKRAMMMFRSPGCVIEGVYSRERALARTSNLMLPQRIFVSFEYR